MEEINPRRIEHDRPLKKQNPVVPIAIGAGVVYFFGSLILDIIIMTVIGVIIFYSWNWLLQNFSA